MSGDEDSAAGDRRRSRQLLAELSVDLDRSSDCPLTRIDGEVVDVHHQLVDDECRADATVRPGADDDPAVVHATADVTSACPCAAFAAVDCVPDVVAAAEGRLRVRTYLPDRETLTELVERLRETAVGLRLRRLRRVDRAQPAAGSETVTVELTGLTEKQREAATRAVATGYYETPREISFEELAADLGISKSALSQRLNAVESALTTAAFPADD
jgi:predicted DNA binding protein